MVIFFSEYPMDYHRCCAQKRAKDTLETHDYKKNREAQLQFERHMRCRISSPHALLLHPRATQFLGVAYKVGNDLCAGLGHHHPARRPNLGTYKRR